MSELFFSRTTIQQSNIDEAAYIHTGANSPVPCKRRYAYGDNNNNTNNNNDNDNNTNNTNKNNNKHNNSYNNNNDNDNDNDDNNDKDNCIQDIQWQKKTYEVTINSYHFQYSTNPT